MFWKSFIYFAICINLLIHYAQGLKLNDGEGYDETSILTSDIHTENWLETLKDQDQTTSKPKEDSATDEFPTDLFTPEQHAQGAIVLHLFAAIYFFTLLGILCNDYFLPCVECICCDLNISKDVAAATFMATATSMPEFFTNTISTLITNSDMGLGTIIGSLMFNTLGVAALSGVAVSKSVQLDWWPVARDCIFYSFNILVLILVAWGGKITFYESLAMVALLFTYYILMFSNKPVMKFARVFIEDRLNCCHSTRYDLTVPIERSAKAKLPLGKTGKEEPHHYNIFVISQKNLISNNVSVSKEKILPSDDEASIDSRSSLFKMPKHGILKKIWFLYSWPIKAFLRCVCPSPETNRRFYPLTFIICIILIGINAYMIVWMLTIFGATLGIPDIVMGLTLLAAGSTMPEALSSLISVRKGESGIGVSNSLGANSLAILLSLGVPWFIQNCKNYNKPDGQNAIIIGSQGIEYTIGILLLSTLALFIIMSFAGFRLRKSVGVALFSVYSVFIVLQILIEMNVFFPAKDA